MEPGVRTSRPPTEPPRILVVDDDQEIRTTVADILGDEGYEPLMAANGAAALALVRDGDGAVERPALILLDVLMPVMDGREFARAYREEMEGPHAPIVVMTAAHDVQQRADDVGAVAALPKPFDLGILLDLVARLAPPRKCVA